MRSDLDDELRASTAARYLRAVRASADARATWWNQPVRPPPSTTATSTTLTRAEVIELAHLARLALDEATVERLRGELGEILAHVAHLGEVDTDGVEPMTHAVAMTLRLRPDEPEPPLPVEVALAGAAAVRDDGFVVPAVIREP